MHNRCFRFEVLLNLIKPDGGIFTSLNTTLKIIVFTYFICGSSATNFRQCSDNLVYALRTACGDCSNVPKSQGEHLLHPLLINAQTQDVDRRCNTKKRSMHFRPLIQPKTKKLRNFFLYWRGRQMRKAKHLKGR